MVERIREIFPNVPEKEVLIDINTEQLNFARETRYLEATSSMLEDITSNIVFALPADFNDLMDISFYDINGNPLYKETLNLTYTLNGGSIYFIGTHCNISVMPGNIAYIFLDYHKKPTTITHIGSVFSIDDEYVDAIYYAVMGTYYIRYEVNVLVQGGVVRGKDWKGAQFCKTESDKLRLQAKKYALSKDTSPIRVKNYGMGGHFYKRKHTIPIVGITDTTYDGGDSTTPYPYPILDGGTSIDF